MDEKASPATRVYTQKDIARIYAIPRSSLYEKIKEGAFPEKLLEWGRAARWDAGEVEAWYARRTARPAVHPTS